jgi:predicted nucleotidyltransferase component of viral defense system
MIPRNYLLEWSGVVPWIDLQQVEQDLLITTTLITLYTDPVLKETFAFRGGTALNKLIFKPAFRYSEDIDLVQIKPGPIGELINRMRQILSPLLGDHLNFDRARGGATLIYKLLSEENLPLRLKIEINTREHFTVLGFQDYPFESNSSWKPGSAVVKSYAVEELLGTKLRALYQRRKGRDLYDLYTAFTSLAALNSDLILRCFTEYMQREGHVITRQLFLKNMEEKLKNNEFRYDITPLLPQNKAAFNPDEAYELVRTELLEKL